MYELNSLKGKFEKELKRDLKEEEIEFISWMTKKHKSEKEGKSR
ncbi:hypothetical protein [Halalkalibacillus sediminis]|nr:hypothetical protein [Halalkalibacillus sediminis]